MSNLLEKGKDLINRAAFYRAGVVFSDRYIGEARDVAEDMLPHERLYLEVYAADRGISLVEEAPTVCDVAEYKARIAELERENAELVRANVELKKQLVAKKTAPEENYFWGTNIFW